MVGIRNPEFLSAIDTDIYPHEKESYCENCKQVGVNSRLQKRVYRFNDKNEPVVDTTADENFVQCYTCGNVVPIYEVKHEPKLADFVEITDNPFDSINSNKMEVLNQSANEAIADKRNPIKRKYKQKKEFISSVNDSEITGLLEDGSELIYYKES